MFDKDLQEVARLLVFSELIVSPIVFVVQFLARLLNINICIGLNRRFNRELVQRTARTIAANYVCIVLRGRQKAEGVCIVLCVLSLT